MDAASPGSTARSASPCLSVPKFEALSRSTWALCLVVTALPPGLLIIATSDLTSVGAKVWILLHEVALHLRENNLGVLEGLLHEGYQLFFGVGVGLLFASWLLELAHWRIRWLKWGYCAICATSFLAAAILYAEYAPSVLLIVGFVLGVSAILCLRRCCIKDLTPDQFSFMIAVCCGLVSVLSCGVWLAMRTFLHRDLEDVQDEHDLDILKGKKVTFFILLHGPLIVAIMYLFLAFFCFTRGQFHVSEARDAAHGLLSESAAEGVYVGQELKFVVYCFCVVGMGAWVAASVAGQDSALSNAVLRMAGSMFVMLCVHLLADIGPERILKAAHRHPDVQWVMDVMLSDWMKAIVLSIFWPLVPLGVVLECVHQRIRRRLLCIRCIDPPEQPESAGFWNTQFQWLTYEANQIREQMGAWDWSSILSKSIIFGIGYFLVMVGGTTGTTIFLAWLSQLVESWSMISLLVVLFCVGLVMFLIPIVPGLPIYLVSGIVVVRKFGEDQFAEGVAASCLLCWAIKLCSNVVLMKCVGEPLAKNARMRMMVGTHTPTMRAAEEILRQPGMTLPKVAVLVGGPDWPTAILCSMLKVPVLSMLVGISPVVVLILPVVMAAAYKVNPDKAELANVLMMVSAAGQMGSMVVAGIYIRAVKAANQVEFEVVREEDEAVVEAVRIQEEISRIWKGKTRWELMPRPIKMALVMGSWFAVGMLNIYLFDAADTFRPFDLSNKISDLPGGNPINIFKYPTGYISLGFLIAQVACWAAYDIWCKKAARRVSSNELTDALT